MSKPPKKRQRQSIRAKADHITDCVFLPAHTSSNERAEGPHCEWLPLCTLSSWKALLRSGAFTSIPRSAGPSSAEAEQWLCSWVSQMDQMEEMKTGLSSSFPIRYNAHSLGSEACPTVSSICRKGSMLRLSSSEEVDVEDVDELSQSLFFAQAYCQKPNIIIKTAKCLGSGAPKSVSCAITTLTLGKQHQGHKTCFTK